MANPTNVAQAISAAPVGTVWKNADGWQTTKTQAPNGKISYRYEYINPKTGLSPRAPYFYTDPAQAVKNMDAKAINQATSNPAYSVKAKPKPKSQKTPNSTANKKQTPKKDPEEDKQFDQSDILMAQSMQTALDDANFDGLVKDWRVRLALAPGARYLYAGDNPGILQPLQSTNGVIFPYTPTISVSYAANYEPVTITHSNYKVFQYTSSSVDSVNITADFTCQDVYEARYLLAVIHFFKTMTKMFYGQDQYPIRGTPPPLCYMFGMGGYQFSAHPLAINGFTYNLPQDVDYIQTTAPEISTNSSIDDYLTTLPTVPDIAADRLGTSCAVGGKPPPPKFNNVPQDITTWVPTKIQLAISCVPMMSRNQTSNYFSVYDYASGHLIKGQSRPGGGMW